MTTLSDLRDFFKTKNCRMIIASDAETRVSVIKDGNHIVEFPAGGVSVAFDPIAQATNAYYIARAKNPEERRVLNSNSEMTVKGAAGDYILKRLFFDSKLINEYYYGFSNQTLWPLCHVAFVEPTWTNEWYKSYRKVNEEYAKAIKHALDPRKKNFVWINDYQLALVPYLLGKPKNTTIAMFWHIPWPTWEIFRILPYKNEILKSLLATDLLAFHRGYHARNFLDTVEREMQSRIDRETQRVYLNKNSTYVRNLPMGIDVDVISSLVDVEEKKNGLWRALHETFGNKEKSNKFLDSYFKKYKVIFGVDRLDYTKGITHRLQAVDRFFEKNRGYIGKAVYLGIIAPSREPIPAYQKVKKDVMALTAAINEKYGTSSWRPIHIIYNVFERREIINFYHRADACLVTPLDDGMNLVSKEFVVASSLSSNPGMLVLSQFAGSAIDLTSALIVNPYDIEEVADAIKKALEMPISEKKIRVKQMAENLSEKNIYDWGIEFIKAATS